MGAILALYLVIPLWGLLVHLVTAPQRGFGTPGLWSALSVSIVATTISTVLIALFGIPLAYALAKSPGRLASAVGIAVQVPLALPPLVSGILLISLVGPDTFLGRLTGGRLTESVAGVVLAQTFVSAPFLVIAARSAFADVDPAFTEVAATLGHREWSRFWLVSLPVAAPGVRAGLLLAWLRAFGEFGATVILAYHPYTIPVFTYVQFSSSGLSDTLAPSTLAVATAVVVLGLTGLRPRRRRAGPPIPAPVPPVTPGRPAPHAPDLAFDLDCRQGSFHLRVAHRGGPRLAVLGPSGAGKSTLLRCLAGLVTTGANRVAFGDRSVSDVAPEDRRVGYVPQQASLPPNRTVWRQLLLGRGVDPGRAAYWLHHLQLDGLEDRFPSQLSVGQRQRVAMARALATDPAVLLLDEPFSSLDTPMRREMCDELRRLLRGVAVGVVIVTHDPREAAVLADDLLLIEDGTVLQEGSRADTFAHPASPAAARLLGVDNVGAAVMVPGPAVDLGAVTLPVTGEAPGAAVLWCVAPEDVVVRAGGAVVGDPAEHPAVVIDRTDLGTVTELLVELGPGVRLVSRTLRCPPALGPGAPCAVHIDPAVVRVWADEGDRVHREFRVS